jgi:hypothetical protein
VSHQQPCSDRPYCCIRTFHSSSLTRSRRAAFESSIWYSRIISVLPFSPQYFAARLRFNTLPSRTWYRAPKRSVISFPASVISLRLRPAIASTDWFSLFGTQHSESAFFPKMSCPRCAAISPHGPTPATPGMTVALSIMGIASL